MEQVQLLAYCKCASSPTIPVSDISILVDVWV